MSSSSGRFNDGDILGPQPYPCTMRGREAHVYQLEGLIFRADFDSANLKSIVSLKEGSKEFQLHTLHDCDGTEFETGHRSWFYFSVRGHKAGDYFIFNVMNMNKQAKLFQNDFRPVFRTFAGADNAWERIRFPCSYQTVDGDFQIRFRHKFESAEETFFAYTYPNSYEEVQSMLWRVGNLFSGDLEQRMAALGVSEGAGLPSAEPSFSGPPESAPSASASAFGRSAAEQQRREERAARREEERAVFGRAKDAIYYRRQLLGLSLEGRRVDLLTITDRGNVGDGGEEEQGMPADCFPAALEDSCHAFPGKKVVFVSSRVHPGETPGSHLFNGLLAFLLRPTDQRAVALRRMFVFKLVPLLNPDGVANGHYRCDTLGKNLNRFYLDTNQEEHPTIHCVSQLLQHYHGARKLEFYMDLHAHANKRGVFAYGNALEGEQHIDTLTFCKLVALNNPHFEFEACNFTERNMAVKDKNGDSKEGSGRVALFQQTGLVHIYTIEANYCCSRIMNQTSPASNVNEGRVSPPNRLRASPKYSPELLHGTGRALLIGVLDLYDANPWSRLLESPYASLEGVRNWVKACLAARQDCGSIDSDNSSNALPRGASFKKAGDTIDECKADKVFAEVERRRRASTMKRVLSSNARTTAAVNTDGPDGGKAREGRRVSSTGSAPAWNSPKARATAAAAVATTKQTGRAPVPRSSSARRQTRASDGVAVEEAPGSGWRKAQQQQHEQQQQQQEPLAVTRVAASKSSMSVNKPYRSPALSVAPSEDATRVQFKSVAPVSLDWHEPKPLLNACQPNRATTTHGGSAFPIGRAIHEATTSAVAHGGAKHHQQHNQQNSTILPMLPTASSPSSSSSSPTTMLAGYGDTHHCFGGKRASPPPAGLMMTGMLKGKGVRQGEQGGVRQPLVFPPQQQQHHNHTGSQSPQLQAHHHHHQQQQQQQPAGGRKPVSGGHGRDFGVRERPMFVPVEAE